MELTDHILPNSDQFAHLKAMAPDEPCVMVNIIRFKDQSSIEGERGWEAYARYTQNVMPIIKATGAKLLWQGTIRHTIVGGTDRPPDTIFLVSYPSVKHFLDMISTPAYQEIAKDRTAGLEFGGLYAATTDYSIIS